MTTPRDGRTLPWRIFHRTVRPYALAVSLATAVAIKEAPVEETVIAEELTQTPDQV